MFTSNWCWSDGFPVRTFSCAWNDWKATQWLSMSSLLLSHFFLIHAFLITSYLCKLYCLHMWNGFLHCCCHFWNQSFQRGRRREVFVEFLLQVQWLFITNLHFFYIPQFNFIHYFEYHECLEYIMNALRCYGTICLHWLLFHLFMSMEAGTVKIVSSDTWFQNSRSFFSVPFGL